MRRLLTIALSTLLGLALLQPVALAQPSPQAAQPRGQGRGQGASITELTVRVSSPEALRALERELARTGGRIRDRSADGKSVLVQAPSGVGASAYAGSIAEVVPVRFAEPVGLVTASVTPTDPFYGAQWALPAVGAPAAWDYTWGSSDVTVAVIDTGVDLDHPDLVNRVLGGGWDFVDDDAIPDDVDGHGTGVAGIIAAQQDNGAFGAGIAPGVRVLPVRVLDANGDGNTFDVAQAVRYATDHGADVINLSLGGTDFDSELSLALNYALDNDVVVVAASGNTYPGSPQVQYPAREPGVIAVGAQDQTLAVASFSNRGPELDLVAPGVVIFSTVIGGQSGYWSGTSMSCPMVAGTAALMRSRDPEASVDEVEALLYSTARDLGTAGRDDTYGNGMVQTGSAVAALTPAPPDTVSVFRFYNARTGSHFYTPSAAERDMVIDRWPTLYAYEGVAYTVNAANAHPLYRFYNVKVASHFYTASVAERDQVIALWPHIFAYEGETYNVALAGPESQAVYRFFSRVNGSHFFTASAAERDLVRQAWPHIYDYEGPAFYRGM